MREIKFRAYLKKYGCMVNAEIIDWNEKYIVHEDLNINFHDITAVDVPDPECVTQFQELELMQFTGLHDKNKKPIYEGDIIKYDNDLYIIKFGYWEPGHGDHVQSAYGYYLDPIDKEKSYHEYCPDEFCEVVGNIYENSELLED